MNVEHRPQRQADLPRQHPHPKRGGQLAFLARKMTLNQTRLEPKMATENDYVK
jgi:hypothetical protein